MDTQERRPLVTVNTIERTNFLIGIKRRQPGLVLEIDGHDVDGLDPPHMGGTHLDRFFKSPRVGFRLVDSRGWTHYAISEQVSSPPNKVWCFSHQVRVTGNVIRVHLDPWLPFEYLSVDGCGLAHRVGWEALGKISPGDPLTWQFPFTRTWKRNGQQNWGVLSAGAMYLPVQRPQPREAELWPEYVRRLRDWYKTDAEWDRLISSMERRYLDDLRSTAATIYSDVVNARDKKPRNSPLGSGRQGTAYCFTGHIPGLDGADGEGVQVENGVAFGDKGLLAWTFRLNDKLIIVVDRPAEDTAAWVFDDEEAAAQLLHPEVGVDWRKRHAGLRERAIYWCPHLEGWKDRLTLLVLRLLADAGHEGAGREYDRLAKRDDAGKRAAGHVRRLISNHRTRSEAC